MLRVLSKTPRLGRFFLGLSVLCLSGGWLTGCNTVNPAWDTLQTTFGGLRPPPPLVPGIPYLSVKANGHQAYMALGYRDAVVQNGQSVLEDTWYSGQQEMLVLRDGRLHRAMGMTHEWRRQDSQPPAWSAVQAQPTRWQRLRDVMPGYRTAVRDVIDTRAIAAPRANTAWPAGVQWFEDQVSSTHADGRPWLYTQRFAWHPQQGVLYSEQCLAPEVCLTLSPVPTTPAQGGR